MEAPAPPMHRAILTALTVAPLLLVGAGLWSLFGWGVACAGVGGLWWFDKTPTGTAR